MMAMAFDNARRGHSWVWQRKFGLARLVPARPARRGRAKSSRVEFSALAALIEIAVP